jgi:hypothetical protein
VALCLFLGFHPPNFPQASHGSKRVVGSKVVKPAGLAATARVLGQFLQRNLGQGGDYIDIAN